MKKIVLLIVAVAVAAVANAQFVVGLQGGFFKQDFVDQQHDTIYPGGLVPGRMTTTEFTTMNSTWLGGAQLGYQITPKLYVGVMAGYLSSSSEAKYLRDSVLVAPEANSEYAGMWMAVDNHLYTSQRAGWTVAPVVRYELAKYGNMHFNIMLQGTIQSMGYTTYKEYYNKPFDGGELVDFDEVIDSISDFSWGVSLRPTLTYEFSHHLSAELSLDFLSIGYIANTRNYDGYSTHEYITNSQAHQLTIPPHTETTTTLYAGLNTLMETLRWESPTLRLGFNYKF